jgi:hypothetical protein
MDAAGVRKQRANSSPGGDPTGTIAVQVTIPAGTTYARFSLFNGDVAAGSDIDLYVYRGATPVGSSGSGGSDEEVSLVNPVADVYTVYIHGWGLPTWLLGSTAAGNLAVTAPSDAVTGQTGAITLTTSNLAPSTRYLGSLVYGGIAGLPNPTIVRIDTP